MDTSIQELAAFGQSIWLDNINRSLIESGQLKQAIECGLRGVTSNPSIFDKAISFSDSYDQKISQLHAQGKSTFQIYDQLTVEDIQDAADMFFEVYKSTQGLDGYVSLEINPQLAYDLKKTIQEGLRLHKRVKRPNVMFKVPATDESFPAIEEFLSRGINVNVTLIFSLGQYIKTAQSYLKGIKRFVDSGGDPKDVRSVASVFVSRIDSKVDKLLDQAGSNPQVEALKGKAAVANSALIYEKFLEIIQSSQFRELKAKGTNLQRVLWGSTSTKNPAYSDIKYVSELIAKDTVNTLPETTYLAFLDHGKVKVGISQAMAEAKKVIKGLKNFNIDIDQVCGKLLTDGVIAFEKAFESLLGAIESKSKR